MALKTAWWVTGELCGCIGFFSVPHNSHYLTTGMIIHCVVAFSEARHCSDSGWLRRAEQGKRAAGVGVRPCLTSPIHLRPPHCPPQAWDSLWGCGRADYRPVPLGVGAILPLPPLFYLQDLRWGVWECMGSRVNLC